MHAITGGRILIRIEVIPTPALGVPGYIQGLQAAVPGLNQVLLQRCYANDIADRIASSLAVEPIGRYEIRVIFCLEAITEPFVHEHGIIEITQDIILGNLAPGPRVM